MDLNWCKLDLTWPNCNALLNNTAGYLRRPFREPMNISVIGAGQMGNGIAHVFAQSGHSGL